MTPVTEKSCTIAIVTMEGKQEGIGGQQKGSTIRSYANISVEGSLQWDEFRRRQGQLRRVYIIIHVYGWACVIFAWDVALGRIESSMTMGTLDDWSVNYGFWR